MLRTSLLVALLLCSACATRKPQAESSEDFATYHNQGLRFALAGNFTAAQLEYEKALAINPDSLNTIRELGLTYDELGNSCKAVELYTEVLKRSPHDVLALSNRGNSRWSLFDFAGALADLSAAVAIDPSFVRAHRLRGDLRCWLSGKVKLVLRETKPDPCLNELLNSSSLLPPLDEHSNYRVFAMSDFREALKLYPESSETYNSRGICYCRAGDKPAAKADFERALKLDPRNEAAEKNLSVALAKCGTF